MLVDDHADLARSGVRSMLEDDTEFDVVGEASNGREVLEARAACETGLFCLRHPDGGGDGLARLAVALGDEHPAMRLPQMPDHAMTTLLSTYMARAVAGGAAGYLLKGLDQDEMIDSLRAVANGEMLPSANQYRSPPRGASDMAAGRGKHLTEPLSRTGRAGGCALPATGLQRDMGSGSFHCREESTVGDTM